MCKFFQQIPLSGGQTNSKCFRGKKSFATSTLKHLEVLHTVVTLAERCVSIACFQ